MGQSKSLTCIDPLYTMALIEGDNEVADKSIEEVLSASVKCERHGEIQVLNLDCVQVNFLQVIMCTQARVRESNIVC